VPRSVPSSPSALARRRSPPPPARLRRRAPTPPPLVSAASPCPAAVSPILPARARARPPPWPPSTPPRAHGRRSCRRRSIAPTSSISKARASTCPALTSVASSDPCRLKVARADAALAPRRSAATSPSSSVTSGRRQGRHRSAPRL
jgi:hypothetical protein